MGLPGIPAEELLNYFTEAAEALDFLCQEKLSHRDIKPQNLLHLKGHAKVADFGIARRQVNAVDHTMNTSGTPAYMPPEVWSGDISLHSDQYSFAVTWYEMRTSRLLFSGKTLGELCRQHLQEKPDVSGLPEPEQKVLLRAWPKSPMNASPAAPSSSRRSGNPWHRRSRPGQQGFSVKVALGFLAVALTAVLLFILAVALWRNPPRQHAPRSHVKKPPGWEPAPDSEIIADRNERRYYQRLVRKVGGQQVVMVLVPQKSPQDPKTFYMMENKVWNGLYATFLADPAQELFTQYRNRLGCDRLVSLEILESCRIGQGGGPANSTTTRRWRRSWGWKELWTGRRRATFRCSE